MWYWGSEEHRVNFNLCNPSILFPPSVSRCLILHITDITRSKKGVTPVSVGKYQCRTLYSLLTEEQRGRTSSTDISKTTICLVLFESKYLTLQLSLIIFPDMPTALRKLIEWETTCANSECYPRSCQFNTGASLMLSFTQAFHARNPQLFWSWEFLERITNQRNKYRFLVSRFNPSCQGQVHLEKRCLGISL